MRKTFQDKAALVTGGSRGIGAAIAQRLAKDGCHVAISYSGSKDKALALVSQLEKEGVQAIAVQADQADSAEIEKLVQKVVEKFGKIDILVNNAGIYIGGAIDDAQLDIKGILRQMAVNIEGVFKTTRAAIPFMPEGGRIINMGSINGERMTESGGADYAATKAALIGYTRGWARDLGPKNITVNLIQPGPINTDMNPDNTEFANMVKKSVALGRYGKPEEIAAAVAFLASPDASYITGTALTVDGGFLA
ncbi:MAG: SDR family NAD(P)-dependent oxidoreductase [Parachlamydiaceae bacterium]